jgi:ubiquinone biosynthesis protein UbiJ
MTTSALAMLQALFNRALAASTPARALLTSLEGRSFAIIVGASDQTPIWQLRLAVHEGGLTLATTTEAADATVTGSPLALAAMLPGLAESGRTRPGIVVAGDAEVAAKFQKLLRYAPPDVEAELARLLGDRAAFALSQIGRRALTTGHRLLTSLARSTGEYLTEESRDLVPRAELDVFLDAVDRLREDVDRAAARLARLSPRSLRPDPAP